MKFKLKNYLKYYKWQVILGPFFKLLESITDLITPILIALILDVGIPQNDKKYIINLSIIIIIMNLLGFGFAILCQKCASLASQGIGKKIRKDMYGKIVQLSSADMDKYTTMSITNRTVHDVGQIQTAIGMTIRQVARTPFLLIGSTIMAMIINIKLSCIFFIVIPFILLVFILVIKKSNPLYIKAKSSLDKVSNVTRENLSGNRVVRAFDKQQDEIAKFDIVNNEYTSINTKIGQYGALLQPLLTLLINMALIAVIYYGGIQVNIGGITQGKIISMINYLTQISLCLVSIAKLVIVYNRTGSSIKRINEIYVLEGKVKQKDKVKPLDDSVEPNITFKNVSFSYNNIKDAIKELNIEVKAGETIGIIGGTGSGKSSFVNLLPRFYDVTKGEISINGTNVKDFSLNDLRNYISIVPQNPTLFSGTIESNLRFRKQNATEEELIKALKISQAYEFVLEKPDVLQSKVERGGLNFSGGQRQRLTIARALVGSPKIIILDDSSSALDYQTDYELRKTLNIMLPNSTKFLVSQRTNSIRQANRIIVLDNGNVAGIGTHSDLLKSCDVYKEIYNSQNS